MRAFSVVYINQIDQSIPSTTEMVKFGKDGVNGKLVAKEGFRLAQFACTIVTLGNMHLFSSDVLPGKVVRSLGYIKKIRLLILSYAVPRVGSNDPLIPYFKVVGYA